MALAREGETSTSERQPLVRRERERGERDADVESGASARAGGRASARWRVARYALSSLACAACAVMMMASDRFPRDALPGSIANALRPRARGKDESSRAQLSAARVFDDFCRAIDGDGDCERVKKARDGLKGVSDVTFEALVLKAKAMKRDESEVDGQAFLGAYDVVMTQVVSEPRALVKLVPEWSTAGLGFSSGKDSRDEIEAKKLSLFVADIFPVLRRYPNWDMSDTNAIRFLTRHIHETTLSDDVDDFKQSDFMRGGAAASLAKNEEKKNSLGVLPPKDSTRVVMLSPFASSEKSQVANQLNATSKSIAALGKQTWNAEADGLPKHFDSRKEFPACKRILGTVRDQGKCGSCWAVAATEVMNDRLCIATNGENMAELSPQFALSCFNSGDGCDGGDVMDTLILAVEKGIPYGGMLDKEACLPYEFEPCDHPCMVPGTQPSACPTTCTDGSRMKLVYPKSQPYTCPEGDVACIAKEIMAHGSVAVTFGPVHEDFYEHKSGVYEVSSTSGKPLGQHATKLIGWGVTDDGIDYWIMVNSWRNWGDEGVGRVRMGTMSIEAGIAGIDM